MSNTKMSDVFDLPVEESPLDQSWFMSNCKFGAEINVADLSVQSAINHHDKLVEALEVFEVYMKDNAERMTELKDMRMRLMVIQALQAIKGDQE